MLLDGWLNVDCVCTIKKPSLLVLKNKKKTFHGEIFSCLKGSRNQSTTIWINHICGSFENIC